MRNLIIILVVLFLLYLLYRWFVKTPSAQVASQLKRAGLYAAAAVLLIMVVTGRAHWLYAFLAGALPFAQRLFTAWRTINYFRRFTSRGQSANPGTAGSTGQASSIETGFFRMTLDHDTGEMTGQVLAGTYQNRQLSDMKLDQLLDLMNECQQANDNDSAAVLESYLDRYHNNDSEGNWRDQYGEDTSFSEDATPSQSTMTEKEACLILGLQQNASKDQVKEAHRRLMQKYHPDRGGSTYLSAKINQAKDCLLNKNKKRKRA